MDNTSNSSSILNYDECKEITNILFAILSNEDYLDSVEKTMPDMITCTFKHSDIQPKTTKFPDLPILACNFVVYSAKIIFAVSYFTGKNCKDVVRRINSELPFKKNLIDTYSDKVTLPINMEFLNNNQISAISNLSTSEKIIYLKQHLDEFFVNCLEQILDKVLEIALNIVVSSN